MGQVGVLESSDNPPFFEGNFLHYAINPDHSDLTYRLNNPVTNEPKSIDKGDLYIE